MPLDWVEHTPADYGTQLVPLDSAAGQRLALTMSEGWRVRASLLHAAFEPQQEGSWCALASTVVALRAMRSTVPEGLVALPTQRQLFDEYQPRGGVSLSELDAVLRSVADLRCSGLLRVELHAGHEREMLHNDLFNDLLLGEADNSTILINYMRLLNGMWTGHWSVLGGLALDGEKSYALVLDVAAHKVAVHWIPLAMLVACICTLNSRGECRGYLRLSLDGLEHASPSPLATMPPLATAAGGTPDWRRDAATVNEVAAEGGATPATPAATPRATAHHQQEQCCVPVEQVEQVEQVEDPALTMV